MVNRTFGGQCPQIHRTDVQPSDDCQQKPGLSPEMVLIEVEDSGIGIAEEHLARIVDPFEQILTGPKNTGEKGTGLGHMGGRIGILARSKTDAFKV